jgi:hypothetical protein
MSRRVLGSIACGSLLAMTAASPAVADAPTYEAPSPAQLATLSQDEISLLDSGGPIDVVMDPASGDVLSVTASGSGASPDISNHNLCNSGDGCYETNKVPYADEGFYGTAGTYYGSWAYRSGYSSGSYTVSACWTTNCGVKISPGSHVTFTSDVTGTSFTID